MPYLSSSLCLSFVLFPPPGEATRDLVGDVVDAVVDFDELGGLEGEEGADRKDGNKDGTEGSDASQGESKDGGGVAGAAAASAKPGLEGGDKVHAWKLVSLFCRVHGLPRSLALLQELARRDDMVRRETGEKRKGMREGERREQRV